MKPFDIALIIAANVLLALAWILLIIAAWQWELRHIYYPIVLAVLACTLGFWKDYRNAEAHIAKRRSPNNPSLIDS